MEADISRLTLITPLFYTEEEALPFEYKEGDGEKLFCFRVNENQCMNFEPEKGQFPGNLIFSGRAVHADRIMECKTPDAKTIVELPRGDYMFAQKRKKLNHEEIIALAIEIHQETLWQRLIPGKKLFLRYLYEDGKTVTQLYRPYNVRN